MWVHAGILEAQQEPARQVARHPSFTEKDVSAIMLVDPPGDDAETEEQKARLYLQKTSTKLSLMASQ